MVDAEGCFGLMVDSSDFLGNFCCAKWLLILLKVLAVLINIIVEAATIYQLVKNKKNFEENTTVTQIFEGKTYVSNVDLDTYKIYFYIIIPLLVINLGINIVMVVLEICTICKRIKKFRFLSILISTPIEISLLILEFLLLKTQGIIIWDDQYFTLVFHITFMVNLFTSASIDYLFVIKEWKWMNCFCYPIVLFFICILTLAAYSLVSFAMIGFKAGTKLGELKWEDFGGVMVDKETKSLFLFLANVGIVSQWLFLMIMTCLVIVCVIKFVVQACLHEAPPSTQLSNHRGIQSKSRSNTAMEGD